MTRFTDMMRYKLSVAVQVTTCTVRPGHIVAAPLQATHLANNEANVWRQQTRIKADHKNDRNWRQENVQNQ